MDKLEDDVFKLFNEIVQGMISELKDAEKQDRGIDLSNFTDELSTTFLKLNISFRDAKTRGKGKKGLFG